MTDRSALLRQRFEELSTLAANHNKEANAAQLATFRRMTDGVSAPRSLAATGGILLGPDYHFDLVRPGVGLYGGEPFIEARPVVTLSLVAVAVALLRAR